MFTSATLDLEAARTTFVDNRKKLEDELDSQHRIREKLDLQLAAKRELCGSLRLGMNTRCLHPHIYEVCQK